MASTSKKVLTVFLPLVMGYICMKILSPALPSSSTSSEIPGYASGQKSPFQTSKGANGSNALLLPSKVPEESDRDMMNVSVQPAMGNALSDMLKQNLASNRPAWDVRAPKSPKDAIDDKKK